MEFLQQRGRHLSIAAWVAFAWLLAMSPGGRGVLPALEPGLRLESSAGEAAAPAARITVLRNHRPPGMDRHLPLPISWVVETDGGGGTAAVAVEFTAADYEAAQVGTLGGPIFGRGKDRLRIVYREILGHTDGVIALKPGARWREAGEIVPGAGHLYEKNMLHGRIVFDGGGSVQIGIGYAYTDEGACIFPNNLIESGSTVTATDTGYPTESATVAASRYLSAGSREPIGGNVLAGEPQQSWAPPARTRSAISGDHGVIYDYQAPTVVQSIYTDLARLEPGGSPSILDFPSSHIRLTGAMIGDFAQLESGLGLSRERDFDPGLYGEETINAAAGNSVKYVLAHDKNGLILGGGTFFDNFQAIGLLSIASTAFRASKGSDIHVLQGAEHRAMIASTEARPSSGGETPRIDARAIDIDEERAVGGAFSANVAGTKFSVYLDSRPVAGVGQAWPDGTAGSYTHRAAATRGEIARQSVDAPFYAGEAIGLRTELSLNESYPALAAGSADPLAIDYPVKKDGSSMASWIGILQAGLRKYDPLAAGNAAFADDVAVKSVEMDLLSDLLVWSQIPGAGRGSPVRYTPLLADGYYPPESCANVVVSDSVVFGDGHGDARLAPLGVDITVVRSGLKFAPRSDPPEISPDTVAADRAGLVYFDALRNRLRVSVALDESGSATVWRDVAVEPGSVQDSWTAEDGQAYVAPRILSIQGAEEFEAGGDRVTVHCEGMSPTVVYYRRVGWGYLGVGESSWIAAVDPETTPLDDGSTKSTFALAFPPESIPDGNAGFVRGQIVEILLMEGDKVAGTSFEYRGGTP